MPFDATSCTRNIDGSEVDSSALLVLAFRALISLESEISDDKPATMPLVPTGVSLGCARQPNLGVTRKDRKPIE